MFRDFDTILPIFTYVFACIFVAKWQLKLTCLVIYHYRSTDSSKVRNESLYKSYMEIASKHRQNEEEEDIYYIYTIYTVISLGSLKKKEKQKLKNLLGFFLSD